MVRYVFRNGSQYLEKLQRNQSLSLTPLLGAGRPSGPVEQVAATLATDPSLQPPPCLAPAAADGACLPMTQRHPGAAFPSSRGRTHLFADTAPRAFAPCADEETDRETMLQISTTPFDDRAQAQVVRDVVLTDIGRIRALAVSTDIDPELRITEAEEEADALRQAIRYHDYEIALP